MGGAREIKGIGKGAILNIDHGIKTGREENEDNEMTMKLKTIKDNENEVE